MSKPNSDTGETKDLSPFQAFIKDNATGPDKSEAKPAENAEPETEEQPPKEAPRQDAAPKSIQDLVRQKTEVQEEGETHEFFTDLKKPGKGASKGDQINYVKDVGRRWEQHAKELEAKLKEAEGRTFDPTETEEWKKTQEELSKYKTEAQKAAELERQLAAVDLQHDPTFRREITEPMARAEQSLIDIVKVSKGEDANELLPILQAAVLAESEGDFLNATRQITEQVDAHFAVAVFDGLKNIRELNHKRAEYLKNHEETAARFLAERHSKNKAKSADFLKGDWKKYRQTAHDSVAGSWDILEQLGNEELTKLANDTRAQAEKWANAGIAETIDSYGGVSESVAQTVALAPELLSLVPLINEAMNYIKKTNDEHQKLKNEYEKLARPSSTASRNNRVGPSTESDQPTSLADFARQQGVL